MNNAPLFRSILVVLGIGALSPLAAQDLTCNTLTTFVNARGEEKTALLGDILIRCQSAAPLDPPPVSEVTVNIHVYLPVPIGNNSLGGPDIDAVLVTNENNCETPSPSSGDYSCGGAYQDPMYASKAGGQRVLLAGGPSSFPRRL